MENLLIFIKDFLLNYGGLAAFGVGVLEEVLFVIPSSLVFLAAGFFMVDPSLSLGPALVVIIWKIALWGSLGVTLGSFLVYGFFYWGGKLVLDRYGKYFGVSWAEIEKVEKKFTAGRTDEMAILFFRALPIWSITVVSAFCGLIRLSWKEFALYTFLGTMIRLMLLGLLGWQLGEAYERFSEQLIVWERYGTVALAVLVLGFIFYIYWRKKNKNV